MEIKSTLTNRAGQVIDVIYRDIDNLTDLDAVGKTKNVSGVHGFCFYGEKMVIVYAATKGYWGHPGGGVELGESIEQALVREVKEETNMRVVSQQIIGYQEISEPDPSGLPGAIRVVTQTRSLCIVEPYGPFLSDPDGDVTEIKLIDPAELARYVDWGKIGEHILQRALELKKGI
jgi:8-oxo-dGTP pyrophosphatase MutT (NUDIX family)